MRFGLLILMLVAACQPHLPHRSRIDAITSAAGGIGTEWRRTSVEDVAWLGGCWQARYPGGSVEEYWSRPGGGSMVGMSRTIRGDSTVGYELMLIRVSDDRLVLEATPHGQGTTVFRADSAAAAAVSFDNPAHDFPQRILYRRAADSLYAQLEGPGVETRRIIEISMERMPCAGS